MKLIPILEKLDLEENSLYRGTKYLHGNVGDIIKYNNRPTVMYEPWGWIAEIVKNYVNPRIPSREHSTCFSGRFEGAKGYGARQNGIVGKSFVGKLMNFNGVCFYNKNYIDAKFKTDSPDLTFINWYEVMNPPEGRYLQIIKKNIHDLKNMKKELKKLGGGSKFYINHNGTDDNSFEKYIKWLIKFYKNCKEYKLGDPTYYCEYFLIGSYELKIVEII